MRIPALCVALAVASFASPAPAQTPPAPPAAPAPPEAAEEDVASVDAIIAALYDVISGPAGPRDWDRFHSLFQPGAVMGSAGRAPDGSFRARLVAPADYAARNGAHFMTNPFYEREIGRRVSRFGPVVQVMSAYETLDAPDATRPTQRGVNSITLFDDGARLWITSITWAGEAPDRPIPDEFLTRP